MMTFACSANTPSGMSTVTPQIGLSGSMTLTVPPSSPRTPDASTVGSSWPGSGPRDTTRSSGLPAPTFVPPAGLWLMTWPVGTVSLYGCVTVPTVSPADIIAASAADCVMPTTSGTMTLDGGHPTRHRAVIMVATTSMFRAALTLDMTASLPWLNLRTQARVTH